jgi:hypothetical protein
MDSNRNSGSFSLLEEEFFRAGALQSEASEPEERFSDLDENYQPRSIWRRLFGRKPNRQ